MIRNSRVQEVPEEDTQIGLLYHGAKYIQQENKQYKPFN